MDNDNSQIAESGNQSTNRKFDESKNSSSRSPLTPDHLFVIAELAHLGMAYLGLVLPEFAKEKENAGKEKREHYAHLKSLYEVAGPETVRHLDEMCQYLYEKGTGSMEQGAVNGEQGTGNGK